MSRPRSVKLAKGLVVPMTGLLLAASVLPGTARAQDSEPQRMTGRVHYVQDGPAAANSGLATGFVVGSTAPAIATSAAAIGYGIFFDLFTGFADTSLTEIGELLDDSYPDEALPVRATHDVTVDFTLEETAPGSNSYSLTKGSVTWSSMTQAEIVYDGGSITDNYSGDGTDSLLPGVDIILVRILPDTSADESGDNRYEFEMDISHPDDTDGLSVWESESAKLTIERAGPDMLVEATTPFGSTRDIGMEPLIEGIFEDERRAISYSASGVILNISKPVDFSNQVPDPLGGGLSVTASVDFSGCTPNITSPEQGERLVYDDGTSGRLSGKGNLSGLPEQFDVNATWEFGPREFDNYDPPDLVGPEVRFRFDELPETNEEFGKYTANVQLDGEAANLCDEVTPVEFELFFPRNAKGNSSGDANWFWYWLQTPARNGVGNIEYAESGPCDEADGYFRPGLSKIFLCDSAANYNVNPVVGITSHYIDNAAVTVLHEDRHRINWDTWGRLPSCTDTDGDGKPDQAPGCKIDTDGDEVPDDVELNPPLTAFPLDPQQYQSCRDIYGHYLLFKGGDEHCIAYWAGAYWPIDSIDEQDWAAPGSQHP